MAEPSPWIINTTDEHFGEDVYDRSEKGLVIVDFWAEWCAPCRMLAPLLERAAEEGQGKLTLVKANTDQCPKAAGEFGVSGIPAVYAVLDRQVIDSFQGLLPEPALAAWVERLGGAAERVEARRMSQSDPEAAAERLKAILEKTPADADAAIALAELQLDQGQEDECRATLQRLEDRGFLEPAAQRIKAALDMKQRQGIDLEQARQAAQSAPDDNEKQLTLAAALLGREQYAEGFEICLRLVERDRHGAGEKARELMVEAFNTLPEDSEMTREYRRKLTMALY